MVTTVVVSVILDHSGNSKLQKLYVMPNDASHLNGGDSVYIIETAGVSVVFPLGLRLVMGIFLSVCLGNNPK